MRLDGVEIKVSVGGRDVARALDALGLDPGGQPRRIGFVEDATVGTALPLFHQGVVLRVRQTGDDEGDATVKLRPCRRSQLTESWLGLQEGDGWKLRVEEDWAGPRRALAASCVADLEPDRIASVLAGKDPVHRLFADGQRQFLSDCTGVPINLDALTLLPLVGATRWEDVEVQGVKKVVAERWTIDELDFLELSLKKGSIDKARSAQAELERAIQALGLERDDDTSKTERVLGYLIGLI